MYLCMLQTSHSFMPCRSHGRVKVPLDACVLGLRKLGPSLRGRKLAFGVALQVAAQLVQGLRELHSLNYVHTGIKPENICWRKQAFTVYDEPPAAKDVDIVILDLERAEPYMEPQRKARSRSRSESAESSVVDTEEPTVGGMRHVRNHRTKSPVFGDRTGMFMSPRLFRSSTVTRADDLEAVYWVVLELVLGKLPWDADSSRREWVRRRKRRHPARLPSMLDDSDNESLSDRPRSRSRASYRSRSSRQRSPSASSFLSLSSASTVSSQKRSRSRSRASYDRSSSARRVFIRRMSRYLDEVRALPFGAEPPYDRLVAILQGPIRD
eukprot:gb/GEZN01012571.1/.p1 GENE.gb/GEZN01012571.1/~~gb/GEZN01012571.1/.p1  ORF type:complete len:324 (+),score=14.15 gb/GEZN01012571.1/:50-1021(+)